MSVPDFQSCMLPILTFLSDGQEHSLAEARDFVAHHFSLSDQDRSQLLPSGKQSRFDNRTAWARVYLHRAGLLSNTKRAHFRITEAGRQLLAREPQKIDIALLDQYSSFQQFRSASHKSQQPDASTAEAAAGEAATPEEILEQAYETIRSELTSELLARVKKGTPAFFESMVVELLLKMGYGRNRAEAGQAIGKSGDEGIDGIISEDRLGLDTLYIQAKKWEGTVGRPEIQKFVGALHGKRARKGVFITTGAFSGEARDYVSHIDPRVVLIDGRELAEYMIDFNLGVTPKETYEVKRIDSDYFGEE
jgi:restriction system protein